jgi:hypothetical protein
VRPRRKDWKGQSGGGGRSNRRSPERAGHQDPSSLAGQAVRRVGRCTGHTEGVCSGCCHSPEGARIAPDGVASIEQLSGHGRRARVLRGHSCGCGRKASAAHVLCVGRRVRGHHVGRRNSLQPSAPPVRAGPGEAMPGTRTDGFDDHPFPLCPVAGSTVQEMACVRFGRANI